MGVGCLHAFAVIAQKKIFLVEFRWMFKITQQKNSLIELQYFSSKFIVICQSWMHRWKGETKIDLETGLYMQNRSNVDQSAWSALVPWFYKEYIRHSTHSRFKFTNTHFDPRIISKRRCDETHHPHSLVVWFWLLLLPSVRQLYYNSRHTICLWIDFIIINIIDSIHRDTLTHLPIQFKSL